MKKFISAMILGTSLLAGCAGPSLKPVVLEECPPGKKCLHHFDSGVDIHGGPVLKFTGVLATDKEGRTDFKVLSDASGAGTLQTSIPSAIGAAAMVGTGSIVSRNQRMGVEHASQNIAGAQRYTADRGVEATIGAANIARDTAINVTAQQAETARYVVDHAPPGPVTTFNIAGGQGGQAIGVGQGGNGYGGSATAVAGTSTTVGVGVGPCQGACPPD